MQRSFTVAVAGTVAAALTVLSSWAWDSEPGRAQPPGADVTGSGVHLTASVDSIEVNPPGNRTPNYLMSFSHATQMSGNFSIDVDGDPITSGQAVAGFILGCGISVAGGVTVGIEPNQGLVGTVSPSLSPPSVSLTPPTVDTGAPSAPVGPSAANIAATTTIPPAATTPPSTTIPSSTTVPPAAATIPPSTTIAPAAATVAPSTTIAPAAATVAPSTNVAPAATTIPPSTTISPSSGTISPPSPSVTPPTASLGPSVGGTLGVTEILTATLGPGQVSTATTATAALDSNTTFPYHIAFNNAALNVAQCASPVSAVPFATTTVSTAQGLVQTTAYGDQFTF